MQPTETFPPSENIMSRLPNIVLCCGAFLAAASPATAQSYHVAKTFTLGGDGGWDYLALDTAGHRLFVARQTRVMVIDPASGKLLAEIPGLNRAHGIAFSYATGKGFATSGADSSVTVFDRVHHLLFSGCRNQVMAISDYPAGKLVTTVPIGQGVAACRFDAGNQMAFASNGDGTLTVIHEDAPDKFTVVANVATKRGARTMELDERTHRVFTVSADFGPPPAATPEHPDRKSTRLNSSHANISYAVFCL